MKNFYQEKPIVAFKSESVEMGVIIAAIKSLDIPTEVKRSVYIIIRNESGNGRSVVNGTNPGGVQSDSGKWPDKWDDSIVATSIKHENRTGIERGFVVFDSLTTGILFMAERLQARGLYIGGTTKKITKMAVTTVNELASAYYKEWVEGLATYHLSDDELDGFLSMYKQAEKLFA